ncbi:hypothetical protein, partial [Pseudomonas mandelii]|uniref:hypothetical protein n=1 Tax=Pseudomonas mandelii TaxID=75612 RepID=UPI003D01B225
GFHFAAQLVDQVDFKAFPFTVGLLLGVWRIGLICSPTDALNMFFGSDLQYLIMEDILVVKEGANAYDTLG